MAFLDSRALRGRRSLRRNLQGLDGEQRLAFQASVADVDPRRFRGLYRDRAQQFLDQEREFSALEGQEALARREEARREAERRRNFGMSASSGPQRRMS